MTLTIGTHPIGNGHPCFIIAEIGINHNGNLSIAKRLIDIAKAAGCQAVKFQKRTPDLCVPEHQKSQMRETPWGYISYLEYRRQVEFGQEQYEEIDRHCRDVGILWTASCWDIPSLNFIEQFNPPFHKIASACLTNDELLQEASKTSVPIILSTGMSTFDQIDHAIQLLPNNRLALLHCIASYPANYHELNLRCIQSLTNRYSIPVGYSGHETGLPASVAAVALGACIIERHITCDRSMWGSDQASSLEPNGITKLVQYIRTIEPALGDGQRELTPREVAMIARLRRS
jgi:N-acetylneuraminate synthase